MDLPDGDYQYKFVDDCCYTAPEKWFYNTNKPTTVTPEGYINNTISVGNGDNVSDQPLNGMCQNCHVNAAEYNKIRINEQCFYICVKCAINIYDGEDEYFTCL